jgi:hypothetical protein
MLRLATLVLFCLGMHLLAAPLPRSAKKGEPIVLPAQLVKQITALNSEIRRRHERDLKIHRKSPNVITADEIDSVLTLKPMIKFYIKAIMTMSEQITLTPTEKRDLKRAREIYERRLMRAEQTGEWKWRDLDVPNTTVE